MAFPFVCEPIAIQGHSDVSFSADFVIASDEDIALSHGTLRKALSISDRRHPLLFSGADAAFLYPEMNKAEKENQLKDKKRIKKRNHKIVKAKHNMRVNPAEAKEPEHFAKRPREGGISHAV